MVAALVVARAGGAGGYLVGRAQQPAEVRTTLVTRSPPTVTTRAPAGLPQAVEEKRAAILAAAEARDFDALRDLIPADGFSYTFGTPFEAGPVAYWQHVEKTTPDRPIETLARILKLPYTLQQGIYAWPFAYGLPRSEATPYERELLGDLMRSYAGESYYGYRAGIDPDGNWVFYVAGD